MNCWGWVRLLFRARKLVPRLPGSRPEAPPGRACVVSAKCLISCQQGPGRGSRQLLTRPQGRGFPTDTPGTHGEGLGVPQCLLEGRADRDECQVWAAREVCFSISWHWWLHQRGQRCDMMWPVNPQSQEPTGQLGCGRQLELLVGLYLQTPRRPELRQPRVPKVMDWCVGTQHTTRGRFGAEQG